MSLASPAEARARLADLLAGLPGVSPDAVLDYEPFLQVNAPAVTVFFDGYDATFWNFTIRVYAPIDPGAQEAQVLLDTLLPAIEDKLDSQWGPVNWATDFNEELRCIVAAWPVQAGREDF